MAKLLQFLKIPRRGLDEDSPVVELTFTVTREKPKPPKKPPSSHTFFGPLTTSRPEPREDE